MDLSREPLFSSNVVKEEIVNPEEGQTRLAAGRDGGWPVKEEVVEAPVVKEEVEDGEEWGKGGYVKRGNQDFGENPEPKRTKWTPGTESGGYCIQKGLNSDVKKEAVPPTSDQTEDSLPYAKQLSFNAHVLLSNEYEKSVKKEEEEGECQNFAEERKICPADGCFEKFLSHTDLVDHMKIHPGPVVCGFCKKSFPYPSKLRRHYTTHTGERREKPFPCTFCDKRFADRSTLRRHIQIHTGERPYECDLCEFKTAHPSALKTHKLIHRREEENPFPCSSCYKRFPTSSQLTVHQRTHTVARTYECDSCPYKTYQQAALERHRLSHFGKYACAVCGFKAAHPATLCFHKMKLNH